ncbi:MAG: ferredoxin [Bacteroidia bacterium]|nr:MAG: ferredoxin [Bacteroidia bacterium]
MSTILFTLLVLVGIGIVAAILLYVISQKFKVFEDPRIDQVEGILPGANCGGCGYPGCRGFADAFVKADDISGFFCPVGGNATMASAAEIVGKAVEAKDPMVAVVRCSGSPDKRKAVVRYDGARSCRVEAALFNGETGCQFGCLGLGDCTNVCDFDAIHMNPETHLPEVDAEKCTSCGACVDVCPKNVIELRKKGPKDRRVFVSCINKEKGGVAKKACDVACIGCMKCAKTCPFEAITVENNLAYIDFAKCRLCRKCVAVCPTGAIWEVNFPPRPAAKPGEEAKPAAAPAKPAAQPAPAAPKEEAAKVEAGAAPQEAPKVEAKPEGSSEEK